MTRPEEGIRDFKAAFMDADDTVRLFRELADRGLVGEKDERKERALLDVSRILWLLRSLPRECSCCMVYGLP
jgi:hypothetical protein